MEDNYYQKEKEKKRVVATMSRIEDVVDEEKEGG